MEGGFWFGFHLQLPDILSTLLKVVHSPPELKFLGQLDGYD
jgi:hypothetical protein